MSEAGNSRALARQVLALHAMFAYQDATALRHGCFKNCRDVNRKDARYFFYIFITSVKIDWTIDEKTYFLSGQPHVPARRLHTNPIRFAPSGL
eukprot:6491819-Amphidinium_carterae.2